PGVRAAPATGRGESDTATPWPCGTLPVTVAASRPSSSARQAATRPSWRGAASPGALRTHLPHRPPAIGHAHGTATAIARWRSGQRTCRTLLRAVRLRMVSKHHAVCGAIAAGSGGIRPPAGSSRGPLGYTGVFPPDARHDLSPPGTHPAGPSLRAYPGPTTLPP